MSGDHQWGRIPVTLPASSWILMEWTRPRSPFTPLPFPPIRKKSHFCKTCWVSFIFGSAFSASVEQSGRLARVSSTKYFKLCRTTPVGECPEQATRRVTVTTIQLDVYGKQWPLWRIWPTVLFMLFFIIFHSYTQYVCTTATTTTTTTTTTTNYYYYYYYYCYYYY